MNRLRPAALAAAPSALGRAPARPAVAAGAAGGRRRGHRARAEPDRVRRRARATSRRSAQSASTRYIDQQLHPERIADTALDARLQRLDDADAQLARDCASATRSRRSRRSANRSRTRRARRTLTRPTEPSSAARTASGSRQRFRCMELSQQKILRAVYSERQLQEVLTDFWFNHFNVDARKGPDALPADGVRARRDSSARARQLPRSARRDREEPGDALLSRQLDERRSQRSASGHDAARQPAPAFRPPPRPGQSGLRRPTPDQAAQAKQRPNMPKGLNENYGRELLELHTLGVDGGYTQKDVTEVARAFTGLDDRQPASRAAGSASRPQLHDDGEKIVLGHTHQGRRRRTRRRAGARHPGDASGDGALHRDEARAPLRQRHAAAGARRSRWPRRSADRRRSARGDDGAPDVAGVPRARRATAPRSRRRSNSSSARCARPAPSVDDARPLVRALQQQLGMPLYQCQPPTGYKDTADAWVNTGALVNRMNVALALASGRQPGVASWRIRRAPESVVAGDMSDDDARDDRQSDRRRAAGARRWRLDRRNFRGAELKA